MVLSVAELYIFFGKGKRERKQIKANTVNDDNWSLFEDLWISENLSADMCKPNNM